MTNEESTDVLIRIRELNMQAFDKVSKALKLMEDQSGKTSKTVAQQQEEAAKRIERALTGVERSATAVGRTMSVAVSLPIAAAFAASVKSAKDFESAFANVRKTIGDVGKSVQDSEKYYAGLRQFLRDTAKEIPKSVDELSKYAALGGQFGISADGIKIFTRTVADLSVAVDGIQAETAAEKLAQIRNVAGNSEQDIARMASSLVALGNAGASSEGQILDLTQRISSAGTNVGLTTPQMFGFAAAIANVGIQAEAGGTAFSKLLSGMSVAVDTGGEKLNAFARVAGMTSEQFATAFKTNAAGAIEAFIKGLARTKDAGENITRVLGEVGVEGARMADVMRALGLTDDKVSGEIARSNKAWQEGNAHTKEAAEKYKTFDSQLKIFGQTLEDVRIEVGTALLPTLTQLLRDSKPLIDGIGELAKRFGELPQPVRTASLGIAGLAATGGPLLLLTAQTIGAAREIRDLAKSFGDLKKEIPAGGLDQATRATDALGGAAAGSATRVSGLAAAAAFGKLSALAGVQALATGIQAELLTAMYGLDRQTAVVVSALGGPLAGAIGQNIAQLKQLSEWLDRTGQRTNFSGVGTIDGTGLLPEGYDKNRPVVLPTPNTPAAAPPAAAGRGAAGPVEQQVSAIAALKKALADLTTEQKNAINEARKYISSAEDIAEATGIAKETVEAFLRVQQSQTKATKDLASEQEKLAKASTERFKQELEAHKRGAEAVEEYQKTQREQADATAKAQMAFITDTLQMEEEAARRIRRLRTNEESFRIDEILRRLDRQKAAVEREVATEEQKVARIKALEAQAAIDMAAVRDEAAKSTTEVAVEAEKTRKALDWSDTLSGLSQAFANLAQIGGDSFGGIAREIAKVIALMEVGSQIGQQFRSAFWDPNKGAIDPATGKPTGGYNFSALAGNGTAQETMAAYGNLATTAVAGYGSMMQATDVAGRGNRALRGGMQGMSIGGAMYPGWGHLIGFGVGALWGAARNPAWEDVQNRVQGERWGFAPGQGISEEFARQIADQAKGQFKGDRATAEMFNFGGILTAAGGPRQSNITALSNQFRDVFSFLQQGKLTAEQTADVIDESWDTMAEAAMKKGGLLTDKLREMIALNQEFGTGSEAIAAFVQGSLTSASNKIANSLGIGNAAAAAAKDTTARDKITALDAESQALLGKEGGPGVADQERIDAIARERMALEQADLDRQNAAKVAGIAGISSEGAASATASAIAGSFAMLQKQGMSLPDALNAVAPAVQALQQQLEATGYSGGAAFEDLQKKIALANDSVAGPGIAAMQQYASSIADLYNGGVLTSEMFAGMASQVAATREALVAQGVDGTAALEMIKPQLQQMWEISQKMPGVLDEATEKMLKEAEAAGMVGQKFKPANERMAEGIERMADLFEQVFGKGLPAAVETGGQAAAESVRRWTGRVRDYIAEVPTTVTTKFTYEVEGDPNEPQRRSGSSSDGDPYDGVPGAANGVWAPGGRGDLTWFGEGGEPELGGPRAFMAGVLADAMRMTGGLSGGSVVIAPAPIIIGGKKIGQVTFEQLPLEARRRRVLR